MAAIHADPIDADVQDGALERADLVDLRAQHVAQLLDHLGREADGHQLVLHLALRLEVALGLVALLLVRLAHLLEPVR